MPFKPLNRFEQYFRGSEFMMKKIEDLNFYELLEVTPDATAQEIHRAYERVRKIYEPNSIALYSLFTPEETEAMHQRIEEAYRTLVYEDNRRKYDSTLRSKAGIPEPLTPPAQRYYEPARRPARPATPLPEKEPLPPPPIPEALLPPVEQPMPPQEETTPVASFIGEFTGPAIKALREQRGISLQAIASQTKVSSRYFAFVEEENFQKLPARTYTRGFLMLFAKALGCDPDRFASDYLKRYDEAMKPPKPK
jgi:curved DNA-binding protein CbpA